VVVDLPFTLSGCDDLGSAIAVDANDFQRKSIRISSEEWIKD